jgi:predicted DNA-binding protein (MmcQ/YjbR family)
MHVDAYNAFCASLPHSTHVIQWGGSHVWKIGTKVYAIAVLDTGRELAFTFKCSQMSFDLLKTQEGLRPAPYLASRGMFWIQRTQDQSMDDPMLKKYIRESYRLASLNLTKRLQKELGLNGL